MNWKDIPLPQKMQHLDKSPQGYPIPYIILVDQSGIANFKVNDEHKVERALQIRLCAICGKLMGTDMWLVGGPLSAFHDLGVYKDTPMHYECGKYALQVCPYLAARNYNTIDPREDKKLQRINLPERAVLVNLTQDMTRPEVFVYIHIIGFNVQRVGYTQYVVPRRPYISIEFWDKGIKLDQAEGLQKIEKSLKEKK